MKPTRIYCPNCGEFGLIYNKPLLDFPANWVCWHCQRHFNVDDFAQYYINNFIAIGIKPIYIDINRAVENSYSFYHNRGWDQLDGI